MKTYKLNRRQWLQQTGGVIAAASAFAGTAGPLLVRAFEPDGTPASPDRFKTFLLTDSDGQPYPVGATTQGIRAGRRILSRLPAEGWKNLPLPPPRRFFFPGPGRELLRPRPSGGTLIRALPMRSSARRACSIPRRFRPPGRSASCRSCRQRERPSPGNSVNLFGRDPLYTGGKYPLRHFLSV